MNKNEASEQKSLFIDLSDRNDDNVISNSIMELKKMGYTQLNLEVKTPDVQEAVKLQVELELFRRIKEIQDLPDWVILKLLLANGKLKDRSFKERNLNG